MPALADEDAVAPSVLSAEPLVVELAVAPPEPPPVVVTLPDALASDTDEAEPGALVAVDEPAASECATAEPSPVTLPLEPAALVVLPSSLV
jgi:hypothetical protein